MKGYSPSLQSDSEVGNVGGLGLTGSVRGHDTPAAGLRELDAVRGQHNRKKRSDQHSRLDRLGDGTDLVDLKELDMP